MKKWQQFSLKLSRKFGPAPWFFKNTSKQCCGSKYIEFGSGSGSRILAQFGSGSRVIKSILKENLLKRKTKEIVTQLSLWTVNLYLTVNLKSFVNILSYFYEYMCGSGSRRLLNTDPIRILIWIQNTVSDQHQLFLLPCSPSKKIKVGKCRHWYKK